MGQFDASLGVLLVGTWANAMLYMLEITQIFRYFSQYRGDTIGVKALVLSILTVDTVGTAATFGTVYMYCVTFWGNINAITVEYWSFPVYCTATALSAALGQGFLISRFYSLSKNVPITAVLSLLATAAFAGGLYTVQVLAVHNTLAERNLLPKPVIVWFGGSTACDVLLALSLVWQLRQVNSAFRSTENMLKRLVRIAISTGSVTSIWALVVLGTFLPNVQGSVAVGFNSCFGRVYALTVLYNLNSRRSLRTTGSRNQTAPTRDVEAHSNPIDLSQIRVEHTVDVQSDANGPKGPTFYHGGETQFDTLHDTQYERDIKMHRMK